jgi:deferrochelatase/peroxidase EfeB
MTRGETAGEENSSQFMPPDDTGEALGLSPARLTLTFGFGPSFFGRTARPVRARGQEAGGARAPAAA